MSRCKGITLGETMVVLALVALAVCLIVIATHRSRRTTGTLVKYTQLRGIHSGLVLYAQDNNDWYPGLDETGQPNGVAVENRYKILTDNKYFIGDYMISPVESKTIWTTGPVTSANYSYAMLQIAGSPTRRTGRLAEWRCTQHAKAPVLADRNTGSGSAVSSIHAPNSDRWTGQVAWNDNHVTMEQSHILPETIMSGVILRKDDLFHAQSDQDVYMVYEGN